MGLRAAALLFLISSLLLASCSSSKPDSTDTVIVPPPTINTTSSGPILDEQTIQKLVTSNRIIHTFSNGEKWSLFAVGEHIFPEGGDFTVVTRQGLPKLISELEGQIASPLSAQGVGNAPTATDLYGNSILWPSAKDLGVIYYEIGSFPTAIRNLIQQAISEWNATSIAIKWQPNNQGSLNPRYKYVTFVGGSNWSLYEMGLNLFGQGCTLATGLSGGGIGYTNPTSTFPVGSTIYFNPSCFSNGVNPEQFVAGVQHEMGHVVGLHHEMSYCGRNNYINVGSGSALDINYFFNYAEKCDTNARNYDYYDFSSMMNYRYNSSNYSYTQKPFINIAYCGNPGRLDGDTFPNYYRKLSGGDIYAINTMYSRPATRVNCRALRYHAHAAGIGWQSYVNSYTYNNLPNQFTGTVGQSRAIEAIQFSSLFDNLGIQYSAHVKDLSWLPYVNNGGIAGTTGQSRQMEAIKIKLVSNRAGCSIRYRAHVAGIGWLNWVGEDGIAGTTGQGRAMEALQVELDCIN